MRARLIPLFCWFALTLICSFAQGPAVPAADGPHFQPGDRLERPTNYREWVWLSSGLGMSYLPAQTSADPAFDNVFVTPTAYRSFLQTGKWPDQTMFVLE